MTHWQPQVELDEEAGLVWNMLPDVSVNGSLIGQNIVHMKAFKAHFI